ncbi:MAG: hypothetical protein QM765_32235 [Myxococcales bacterium]
MLTVPEAVLASSRYPAVLDPTVSPEFGIDAPVTLPAAVDQTNPAVASNGSEWLVVWRDTRVSGTTMIVGTRVSQAGVVLDVGGIVIEPSTGPAAVVAAAFDGTNYLVAVADPASWDVYGVRVAPTGILLDAPPGTYLGGWAQSVTAVSVAFNGSNYLVAWDEKGSSNTYIVAARVSPAGTVVGGTTLTVASSASSAKPVARPSVASDGSNFLVVWQDFRSGFYFDIYASRVSGAGTVLDASGIAVSTAANDQKEPSVDFDGVNYLVVWSDGKWGNSDIFGTRVSPAGAVLDPSGISICQTPVAQTTPAVAFDGTNHVVAWTDARNGGADLYAARVDRAATVLDSGGFSVSRGTAAEQAPTVSCAGATCLAIWQDQRAGTTWDVYGARLGAGAVLDAAGVLVSSAANDELAPAVAFDGTNYLVVWQDRRTFSDWNVYGARVTPSGAVLDPSGIAISTAADDQTAPRVSWTPPNYLVVWADKRGAANTDIYGARVSAEGAVVDPSGLAISTATGNQLAPSVATDGTNYLVVWCDARSGSARPYASRVSAAGTLLDPTGVSLASTSACSDTAAAYDGTRYLAVWSSSSVYSARLSSAAVALDPTPLLLGSGGHPRVAFDGLNFLAVYEKSSGVFGSRVTGAGAILDPTGLPIAPYASSTVKDMPDLACDGSACFVVWRAGTTALAGAFVDQAGTILNPSGLSLATSTTPFASPTVATAGFGRWLVPYQHLESLLPHGLPARPRARRGLAGAGQRLQRAVGLRDRLLCRRVLLQHRVRRRGHGRLLRLQRRGRRQRQRLVHRAHGHLLHRRQRLHRPRPLPGRHLPGDRHRLPGAGPVPQRRHLRPGHGRLHQPREAGRGLLR